MKKTLLLVTAGIISIASYGQNRFYLSPYAGTGFSNAHQDFFTLDANGEKVKKVPVLSYSAGINAGYTIRHFSIEVGLQYHTSGYEYTDLFFGNTFPATSPTGSSKITYRHISVPLNLGYEIALGPKLKLIPMAGIAVSRNLGATTKSDIPATGETIHKLTKQEFKDIYQRISVWGTAAVRLEYRINKQFSIFAGPSIQYMASDLLKTPEIYSYDASQRNYSMRFDFGLNIRL